MAAPRIEYASRPDLPQLETVRAVCACNIWDVPAVMPHGRCGACRTGVRVLPDPSPPHR